VSVPGAGTTLDVVESDQPFARPTPTTPSAGEPAPDLGASELDVLDGLERDLAAVEEAMAGLDGSDVAARVAAVVDSERFTVQRA